MAQDINEEDQVEMPIEETTNTHANGTRAGQRHNANAHGEGRCTWAEWHTGHTTSDIAQVPDGIIEDPGGRTEPGTPDRPPSMLLEGEQPSNCHADDGTAAYQQASTNPKEDGAPATRVHVPYDPGGDIR
ncbi:hypothetical protein BU15DRAFT_80750 [Melanogaster broomeanus]|nr:hypothetical protein BU15DRAFT_80750 [Melanogaster broomeanus]